MFKDYTFIFPEGTVKAGYPDTLKKKIENLATLSSYSGILSKRVRLDVDTDRTVKVTGKAYENEWAKCGNDLLLSLLSSTSAAMPKGSGAVRLEAAGRSYKAEDGYVTEEPEVYTYTVLPMSLTPSDDGRKWCNDTAYQAYMYDGPGVLSGDIINRKKSGLIGVKVEILKSPTSNGKKFTEAVIRATIGQGKGRCIRMVRESSGGERIECSCQDGQLIPVPNTPQG